MEDDNNTASKLMNNEIKEILDNLKDEVWSKTGADSYDKLLDYITNLQQELENKYWDEASIRADVLLEQQDYKSRIEKAVEYINQHRAMYFPSGCGDVIKYVPLEFQRDYYENGSTFTETENLLNILNGKED